MPPELSLNQALFGFGDAVCVSVVQWIAEHCLNPAIAERHALPNPAARPVKYRSR